MVTSAVSRLGRSPEEGIKAPCKSATTGNITLAGTGQILNGVTMNTSDRAIVKDQDFIGENGIYIVGPDAWERANDMNASEDVDNGQLVVDANTSVLYQIAVTGIWSPGNDMTFVPFLSSMPPQITLTNSSAVDLVDIDVPLVLGTLTPLVSQHLEFDFQSVQSKSNATTAAVLFLNPLGGDVNIAANLGIAGLVDGIDVAALSSAFVAHAVDATIHFTEASIDHTAIGNIGSNSHAAIDTHIADGTLHFLEGAIDHVNILNIGTNSHAAIDTHIADATLHFTEASIDHTAIQNIGSNSHAAIDTHIADATIHFTQGAISITASQVSDFATEVAATASVTANTAKVSNISTALSIGTVTGTTFAITSDGGADDVVIPVFTSTDAGLVLGSGGGTANFLRADGTFAAPPGAGMNFVLVTETTTSRTAVAFEAVMVDDDTAAGVVTITLPASVADAMIIVKKLGTTADVIIDGDSAETIDGSLTFTLTAQYASLTIIADGTGWNII